MIVNVHSIVIYTHPSVLQDGSSTTLNTAYTGLYIHMSSIYTIRHTWNTERKETCGPRNVMTDTSRSHTHLFQTLSVSGTECGPVWNGNGRMALCPISWYRPRWGPLFLGGII